MEIFEMIENSEIRLIVKISSEALVGSNVSLNDNLVKKSSTYTFSVNLGNSNIINNSVLSSVSNFFIQNDNIDTIMNNTMISYVINDSEKTKTYTAEKVKINSNLFMGYAVIKLVIS